MIKSQATKGFILAWLMLCPVALPVALHGCRHGSVDEAAAPGPAATAPAKAPIPEPKESGLTPTERVADKYYALLAEAEAFDKAHAERSSKAVWDESFPVPGSAAGIVVDRSGSPVPGARVIVEKENQKKEMGSGRTDDKGRFDVTLKSSSYRGLDLTVEAEGYVRWAMGSIYGGIMDYRVQLDRPVDNNLVTSLLASADPEQRLWMLLEIVGPRQFGLELKDVFPYIGLLREDLRGLIMSKSFEEGNKAPASKARELLFFWFDPADEELVGPGPQGISIPKEVKSIMVLETAAGWGDIHFASEKIKGQPPPHAFSPAILDPEGKHALVEFNVMYAHWGYSQLLFINKQGDQWRLMFVMDYMHYDYD